MVRNPVKTSARSARGVFSDRDLKAAIRESWITAPTPIIESQFQPASLDLRLGPIAYQLRASFLPFREAVATRLRQEDFTDVNLVIDELSLVPGATLQRQSVYLVPLLESLSLPRNIRGKCNPKSTTGRLDVFTRVITHKSARFDEIRDGYDGQLYLEVSPQSFPIRVRAGNDWGETSR